MTNPNETHSTVEDGVWGGEYLATNYFEFDKSEAVLSILYITISDDYLCLPKICRLGPWIMALWIHEQLHAMSYSNPLD